MQIFCRVTDRITVSEQCREEVLHMAMQKHQRHTVRRHLLGALAGAACAGIAGSVVLASAGWRKPAEIPQPDTAAAEPLIAEAPEPVIVTDAPSFTVGEKVYHKPITQEEIAELTIEERTELAKQDHNDLAVCGCTLQSIETESADKRGYAFTLNASDLYAAQGCSDTLKLTVRLRSADGTAAPVTGADGTVSDSVCCPLSADDTAVTLPFYIDSDAAENGSLTMEYTVSVDWIILNYERKTDYPLFTDEKPLSITNET
jgi:hypothetical protein